MRRLLPRFSRFLGLFAALSLCATATACDDSGGPHTNPNTADTVSDTSGGSSGGGSDAGSSDDGGGNVEAIISALKKILSHLQS